MQNQYELKINCGHAALSDALSDTYVSHVYKICLNLPQLITWWNTFEIEIDRS